MANYRTDTASLRHQKQTMDHDTIHGNDPNKTKDLNRKSWVKFIQYYRKFPDKYIIDILKIPLTYFQRVIVRGVFRNDYACICACRRSGKTLVIAAILCAKADLYPGTAIAVFAYKFDVAKKAISEKILNEFQIYPAVKSMIERSSDRGLKCKVWFKNGSSAEAFHIQGDIGSGYQFILIDEAAKKITKEDVATLIEPMKKTRRPIYHIWRDRLKDIPLETTTMVHISSACDETNYFYQDVFKQYYENIRSGIKGYFALTYSHHVPIYYGILDLEETKNTFRDSVKDTFDMEYGGYFVKSNNLAYYPFSLVNSTRLLDRVEFKQPKNTTADYVITHDVAVSDKKWADNSATHVIKLTERADGKLNKEVVLSITNHGMKHKEQAELLRELIFIRFPNTIKLVIDAINTGEALIGELGTPWTYMHNNGIIEDFPMLILDNDLETAQRIRTALPLIRGATASNTYNARYYPYLKGCMEDGTLKLLTNSTDSEELYKDGHISQEEQSVHIEHDFLMSELINIQKVGGSDENAKFERLQDKKKRDRATSLKDGLAYVSELETERLKEKQTEKNINSWENFGVF